MKTPGHWSARIHAARVTSARVTSARATAALGAAALGVCCIGGSASASTARPDAGGGFTIPLAASEDLAFVGQPVTLTATASADVGPTPYYITIYSETTGAELAVCGARATCSAAVSQSTAGSQAFEAFVGDDVPGNGHPGFVLAASNEASVTWWQFIRRGPSPGLLPGL